MNNPTSQETTIRSVVVVNAPAPHAFSVFTEGIGTWFPSEYNMLSVPIAKRVFEPRVGGRVYDLGVDGSECQWARVLVYKPPDRVIISWDLSPRWQIEPDAVNTSEVEVRFIVEAENRTRVELEHRNLERHGEGWEAMRDALGSDGGWPGCLRKFAAVVAA